MRKQCFFVVAQLYERDLYRFLEEAYIRVGGVGPPTGASQEISGSLALFNFIILFLVPGSLNQFY